MYPLRFALALLLLLAVKARAQSQPLSFSLTAATASAASGTATLELLAVNRTDSPTSFSAPAALAATLTAGGRTWPVELRAAPASSLIPATLAPGTFAATTYTLALPADAAGTAIVAAHLAAGTAFRGVLEIPANASAATNPSVAPVLSPVEKPTTTLVRAEPAASVIQRTFADRLAPHEPIYFIYGADKPAAKFQFSFKYKLLDFPPPEELSLTRTVQFAFTQRSLWDIEGESSPFYDTSYMPELIFESLAPRPEAKDSWFTWLGYQTAFKHESNGRDGPASRSLNQLYLRPAFAFGQLDGWHLLVIPELTAYVSSLSDNEDIKDYRGYGQLRLILGRNDGPSLMVTTWAGEDLDHPSVQLDLTLPLRTHWLNFETYLLVQYFSGYGESLRDYRAPSEALRAGFSLVR